MSFLLSIEGMITAAFALGLVLGLIMPGRWKAVACALAAAAALFAAVRFTGVTGARSTGFLDIFFAALWAALGAFPGAAFGSWIHRRVRSSA